jgi:hypothetical protein
MAESKNNPLTKGLSGKIGNGIVFSQRGNKTFASSPPRKRPGPPHPNQEPGQTKFQQAVVFGKAITEDPDVKEIYGDSAGPGQSAYNVAIADFISAPDISEIDLDSYTGLPGSIIKINVTDNFLVTSVYVHIHNPDGTLVEEGNAIFDLNTFYWVYTATVSNTELNGDRIMVTATDFPENSTTIAQLL